MWRSSAFSSAASILCLSAACFISTCLAQQGGSASCLGCICEAASNCNRTVGCQGDVCGPFRITWAYWADSGKPVLGQDDPNSPLAYSNCANDVFCASRSVQGYIARFAKDCNGDGFVNCYDFAALHQLGGYGCSAPLNGKFSEAFNACANSVQGV